jgi:predicted nucleotidyltransferase
MQHYKVSKLFVFGSVLTDKYKKSSEIDFVNKSKSL